MMLSMTMIPNIIKSIAQNINFAQTYATVLSFFDN